MCASVVIVQPVNSARFLAFFKTQKNGLRNKTMVDKLLYSSNEYYMSSGWNVWTLNLINQPIKILESPKVVKPTNKKKLLKNFGDWLCKQPNVNPSLM